LYLGGARSGKSTAAEQRIGRLPATYVATARRRDGDDEWHERLRRHRERRPSHWRTEESLDLGRWILGADPDHPVLVDCLTLWLTHILDDLGAWSDSPAAARAAAADADAHIDRLADAVAASAGGVVLVSNEVGSGIVPATASGRLFRDLLGTCNARIADRCDEVVLVVAGCPVPIKQPLEVRP
jgi:adenosylcobinamide kinase/adenosylcobinamide-phosphate guanylyltransferase